ncbi:MAG: hypothetical protein AAGI44_10230 [Pseudomonadota bacterium]
MISRVLTPLVLATLLMSASAWSQSDTDDDQTGSEAAEESEDVSTGSNEAPPPRSPTDYQASEQISEDLSVSFPVDI